MANKSFDEYEDDGFTIKNKPAKAVTKKPTRKAVAKKAVQVERFVAVIENKGILAETQKTNQAIQVAVTQTLEAMKDINRKPKSLKCDNIKRDSRGLMESFEIKATY